MGLRLKSDKKDGIVSFAGMKSGQIGIIVDTDNKKNYNRIVMKIYDGSVVSLENGDAWSGVLNIDINVRLLPPDTEFVID